MRRARRTSGWSRRAFLVGALGAVAGGALVGCRRGQGRAAPPPTPAAAGAPAPAAPAKVPLPPVANAEAARRFAWQRLTYYGDSLGVALEIDQQLSAQFTRDTGIEVEVIPRPQSSSETYSAYQRFFQARSQAMDVVSIDVIWPGAFAPHLADLGAALGAEAPSHYPALVENDTVDGRLVAMPLFADFGLLYYRSDLLAKYGYAAPPETWEALAEQARRIQEGERASNRAFAGFVFQGNAYEGLTCNALEWLASTGGGELVAGRDVTFSNPRAVAMLDLARDWIGTIAPRGVTTYQEEDARNVFQGGNAAFMRNWPYAYSLAAGAQSGVRGRFDVAPLPAAPGEPHVGTAGGWHLAVSRYSQNTEAAIELVRYMTGAAVQTYRAVVGSFVPTRPALAEQADVLDAEPFLRNLRGVERVTRPAAIAGDRYNQFSTAFFQGVSQMLNGGAAAELVPRVAQRMQRILG